MNCITIFFCKDKSTFVLKAFKSYKCIDWRSIQSMIDPKRNYGNSWHNIKWKWKWKWYSLQAGTIWWQNYSVLWWMNGFFSIWGPTTSTLLEIELMWRNSTWMIKINKINRIEILVAIWWRFKWHFLWWTRNSNDSTYRWSTVRHSETVNDLILTSNFDFYFTILDNISELFKYYLIFDEIAFWIVSSQLAHFMECVRFIKTGVW